MRKKTIFKPAKLAAYLAGNYPLRTVFWVFGVVGGPVFFLALYAVAAIAPFMKASAWQFGLLYTCAWLWATWKTAGKYAGSPVWQRAAKVVVVVLVVLAAAMVLYGGLVAYPVPASRGV
jgi:hypothetical protein